jgi:hypothetical protein
MQDSTAHTSAPAAPTHRQTRRTCWPLLPPADAARKLLLLPARCAGLTRLTRPMPAEPCCSCDSCGCGMLECVRSRRMAVMGMFSESCRLLLKAPPDADADAAAAAAAAAVPGARVGVPDPPPVLVA